MLPGISLAHDLRQALQSGDPKQVAVAIEFATTFNRDVWQHSPSWVAPGWGMSTRREVEAVVQVLKENHLDAPPPENRAGQTYLIEDGYVGTKQQAAAHELGRRLGALTPDNAWVAARGGDLHDMEQADLAGEMFRGLGSGVMPGAGKGDLTRGVAPPDVGPPRTTGEPAWKPPPPPPTETAIYDPATRSWRRPPRGNYEGKATFGEHAVAFRGFSTRNGWAILEGPSGAGGHAYNARGFDGVAFRLEGPFQMRLYDNKALTATTVRSATALVQHLDANLAGLQARVDALNPNDVPRLAEIKETIKNARESLAAGRPLPAEIVLEVTHEGGNSAGISRTLRKAGLVTRTNLDDPDPHLPPVPAPPATALPRPRMAVQPPAPGKAPTRSEPIERPRLGPRQLPGSPPPPERPPTHATLGSPDSGYFPPPFTTPPRFAVPPIAPPAAFQPGPPPQSAGTPGGSPAQTTAAAPSGVPAGPPTAPPASQPPSAALPALPSQPPIGPSPAASPPPPAASPPPPAASPPPPAASPPPPPDPPPVYVPPPPPPAPFAGWGQPDPGNTNSPYGTWQESTAAGGPTGQPPPSPPPSDPPPVYVPPPPPPAPFAGWGQPDPGNTNSPYGTWQENVAPAAPPPQPPTPPPQPQPPAPPAQPPPATPTP